jgi:hypothetical protein
MEVSRGVGGARRGGQEEGQPRLTRRALLQRAASLGVAASTLGALDLLAWTPQRAAAATSSSLPEVQFAIEKYIAPAFSMEGVLVRFGPLYTAFATMALSRVPTAADQATLSRAMATIESTYAFSPAGVFASLAYGVPYFERLPGGLAGPLVSGHMPRLTSEPQRFALEEAQPAPTDVAAGNPGVGKLRFNVPVQIEANDMLLTLRSDSSAIIDDVLSWLGGGSSTLNGRPVGDSGLGGLIAVTSRRLMFNQLGLPRKVAGEHGLPYAESINPQSPMWMGFVDQQVGTSAPPPSTTFLGSSAAKLTNARSGDYFDHGSIVHLSNVILDLEQFYARPKETYVHRVAYMFRSDPVPRTGNADQFTNGGGPTAVINKFGTTEDAAHEATGAGTFDSQPRIGHTTALQRSSRAYNRTPLHIRVDGPGFDSLDVPDGSQQPKLHFSVYVPTADFFLTMRRNQASPDLVKQNNVPPENVGLERFITTTRRQNFLVPPRRHRAFPLAEFA